MVASSPLANVPQRSNMIIEAFERDSDNQIWAVEGEVKVLLHPEFVALHKPQVGDEIDHESIEPPANQ